MGPPATHRIAWDGLSFDVPLEWDLAFQETRLGITRLRLEDPVAVRLSAEWTPPAPGANLDRIMARFQSRSRQLRQAARDSQTLKDCPSGWSAILYHFADDRRLGLIFYLTDRKDLFVFFQIHLDPGPAGEAEGLLRRFMASFRRHTGPLIPWEAYDVAFTMPAGFTLTSAAFNPGLKRFSFGRSLRQLHLWHVSLADLVLRTKNTTPLEWAAGFLNASDSVRGPFFVARDGALAATRPRLLPHWHFMELLRGCLRYRAEVRHDFAANRLVLTCFQYRFVSDLAWLDGFNPSAQDGAAPHVTPAPGP